MTGVQLPLGGYKEAYVDKRKPEAFAQLIDGEIQQMLDPQDYQLYINCNKTLPARNLVAQIGNIAAGIGEPLTIQQSEQLKDIISRLAESQRSAGITAAGGSRTVNSALGLDTATLSGAMVDQASNLLSSQQKQIILLIKL